MKVSLELPSVAFAKETRHNFFIRSQSAVPQPSKSHLIINATKDNRDFDFVDDMESERLEHVPRETRMKCARSARKAREWQNGRFRHEATRSALCGFARV
jgi:hypothetical protein